jgi:hypothetical protein
MDASALIDLGERHYPEHIKVFEPIWDHIYRGVNNGDIISVDYVKTELSKKADKWRENFLSRANGMFQISEDVELEYAKVISDIESDSVFLNNKHRDRFFMGADPWLVALARDEGECTVVSGEKKSISSYGLGAVCDRLDVGHMNLVQYFEANKIGI